MKLSESGVQNNQRHNLQNHLQGKSEKIEMWKTAISSPIGELYAYATENAVCALLFHDSEDAKYFDPKAQSVEADSHPIFAKLKAQLTEYFSGRRQNFDLPLEPNGSEFQLSVWSALREIPFGETRSYSQQAALIGNPAAVRAVGAANGKNPISIVVPCHRVIGKNGALTGFGGGLPIKQFLLDHERQQSINCLGERRGF